MKSRNISFAEVLRCKSSRSPQPLNKANSLSLAEIFEQWEQYPDEDYTLYLGRFTHSFKSHSSTNMFASKSRHGQEEMFDSWIQRQSALNANKQNLSSQPRKLPTENLKPAPTSNKITFQPKKNVIADPNPKRFSNVVNKPQVVKPQLNFKNLENIGGNIQMIKSKTCEDVSVNQIRSPERPFKIEVHRQKQFRSKEMSEQREIKFAEDHPIELNFVEETKPQKRSQQGVKKQDLNKLIEYTSNNIHSEIIDLAKQYVYEETQKEQNEDYMLQSQKSESVQESQDQELLIGNSDRKPLGSNTFKNQDLFSQEYYNKQRENEQLERQRREDAKNKIRNMNLSIFNKQKTNNILKEVNFNVPQEIPQVLGGNLEVGYSFASNPIDLPKPIQLQYNQLRINQIPEIQSQLPSVDRNDKEGVAFRNEEQDENNFRKKYVKEDSDIKSIQSVQLDRQDEEPKSLPNQTFEPKLIFNDRKMEKYDGSMKSSKMEASLKNESAVTFETKQKEKEQKEVKIQIIGYHTNASREEKPVHQKIKLYSSNKSKKQLNSNKSSPSVPADTSHQKQQIQQNPDIKTNPFSSTELKEDFDTKEKQQKVQKLQTKNQATTLNEIKQVKEESSQIKNYHPPTYESKDNDLPSYAVSTPFEPYKPTTAYGKYTTSSNYYNTSVINSNFTQKENIPTYATKKVEYTTTYQNNNTFTKENTTYTATYQSPQTKDVTIPTYSNSTFTAKTFSTKIEEPSYQFKEEKVVEKKGSYLADLQLKQSINVEQPKKSEPLRLKITPVEPKKEEPKSLLDRQLKQSIKESINLNASGQFNFDF